MKNKFLLRAVAASIALLCPLVLGVASPRAGAAPTSAEPPGPVITAVELRSATTLLVQPCPVVLVFHGEITTTRATSVTYTWIDSRGKTWPVRHRRFSLAGVNGVSHKWKVGKPGRMVDYWVQLKVISPESMMSNKAPVHFTCAK
jgi:hypothetical protein